MRELKDFQVAIFIDKVEGTKNVRENKENEKVKDNL